MARVEDTFVCKVCERGAKDGEDNGIDESMELGNRVHLDKG